MNSSFIKLEKFSNLNLEDSFFKSLKEDYPGFSKWYNKKSLLNEYAYVSYNEQDNLDGFLYLKNEYESDDSINPIFKLDKRLKVGTFKIDAHGTTLGEHFIKIILKEFYASNNNEIYVTIFPKHNALINLFEKFGFVKAGEKVTNCEIENVYVRSKYTIKLDSYLDYPLINVEGVNKHLLSIYPKYHTELFPYSRLQTEKEHKVEDISHTNSIEKIYLSAMPGIENFKKKDLVVIYRTAVAGKLAKYNSVATSICTITDLKNIEDFNTEKDFLTYIGGNSIFTKQELKCFWKTKKYPFIIKMLYNIPLSKRIIRKDLIEKVGISEREYFGCLSLTNEQFDKILEIGEVSESFIIN